MRFAKKKKRIICDEKINRSYNLQCDPQIETQEVNINESTWIYSNSYKKEKNIFRLSETKYLRMGRVKFVEDRL